MTPPLPYFRTPERIAALQAAARHWLGTPFRVGSAAPGPRGGVDCARLAEVLEAESGATPQRFTFPFSAPHRTALDQEHPYVAWLENRVDDPQSAALALIFRRVPEGVPVCGGDLLLFSAGRHFHVCVALDDRRFANCLQGVGVFFSDLTDPTYAGRLVAVYRPHEVPADEGFSGKEASP